MSLPIDDDGYRLWLRYEPAPASLGDAYRAQLRQIVSDADTPVLAAAVRELERGLGGILAQPLGVTREPSGPGAVLLGTRATARIRALGLDQELERLGEEGFLIRTTPVGGAPATVIAGGGERGALYGAFHFLRILQTGRAIENLALESAPRVRHRLLNHWDNLDGTIERGYAGFSRWNWHLLPDYLSPEYTDYARATASLGINGSVLTNVNANALVLTPAWLDKVGALASVLRPYGIRVYLTARFNAPVELGELETADPLDAAVRDWWRRRADSIYEKIPDFGGLLVKANSEGQPGPQDYGRSHADGANLLGDALAPHGGIVFWRAFVYSSEIPVDRAKQAFDEFTPLDGRFRDNVVVQVKNGPVDFQPREPFHPLFGAMPKTPLALELQITKEYLGHATHLVYLGPLFTECLRSDTHAAGPGSSVARVVDGSLHGQKLTAIAGVANIGTDRNWCGHPFNAANWYAFGRLAWDPELGAEAIAEEWLKQTFTTDARFVEPARELMLGTRETCVRYMTPLGLHHLMARSHHYGPGPWVDDHERPDWTSVYFHRADREGIGFDRSPTGSDAVAQYRPPLRELWGNRATCPDELLLWFHRVGWSERLRSGRTLWEELCHAYYRGAREADELGRRWARLSEFVDAARFGHVAALLSMQAKEARWWRDACVLYFQAFSGLPLPDGLEPPEHDLEHYRRIEHRYVPGI